ncbi:glycoside hydrolase family 65 protein [Microbacterium sp. NRRL B-14842]|uniref:glycoside hydrolase family 65 protein n=1 Tax=Microbacterium sp. NRRL B-14842 TaxID=3162881 RepID=UPI003D2B4CED
MIDRDRFPVDPWRLIETRYSEEGVGETLFSVGNGYLGLRGNHIEGRGAQEHGTFINGLHETWPIRHAEQAYGFAEVGQTIVNAPDAKVMRLYVDDEPISLDDADVREYARTLDMRTGVLERRVVWETPSGKRVRMRDQRLVSFEERHLAVLRLEVVVENANAPVTISCQLLNRQDGAGVYAGSPMTTKGAAFDPRKAERIADRVLQPAEHWQDGLRSALSYRVAASGMTVAVVADHIIETENDYNVRTLIEPDIAKNVFRVQAKAGVPITITKLVSYHSSRGVPPRELVDRCRRSLDRAADEGVETVFRRQREWLDAFWERSDVQIGGRDDLQQATRWCLFQLAQASARADGAGVPAKGLTGSGYSGHYFWDTEIYVLPFLTYTTPRWAYNALRARVKMLPAARRRAAQLNEAGALFPWRTINGEEASGVLRRRHGAVPHQRRHQLRAGQVRAGDRGRGVLASRGCRRSRSRPRGSGPPSASGGGSRLVEQSGAGDGLQTFHIHGVTGPDEYTTVVNDNLYTNVMARYNLRYAAKVVREIRDSYPEDYAALVERTGPRIR